MYSHVDKGKKTSLLPNLSPRAMHSSGSVINQLSQSSRHTWSGRGFILGSNSRSKIINRNTSDQPLRRAARVFNNAGNYVTSLPLHTELGDMQSTAGRLFLDEVFTSLRSDHSSSTSSNIMLTSSSFISSSRLSSQSHKALLSSDIQDISIPTRAPVLNEVTRKKDTVKQHVTDEMLNEVLDICLTETDTILLLDIPNILVSEDANDTEAIKEANIHYAELCKNHLGNDKYLERIIQTFSGALKDKQVQCDDNIMEDKGTSATVWNIYDSFCNQSKASVSENIKYPLPTTGTTSQGQKGCRGEKGSSSISTGSTISSVLKMEIFGNPVNDEPDPQRILLSESFKYSLSIMERNIVANIFQPRLAAYQWLPVLTDPDNVLKTENQSKDNDESSFTPTLQHLWAFRCEITRGCNITCMTWNKRNPDLLAVGHGDLDPKKEKSGFICCWSLTNPTWPERIFHCHNCVTCIDFSASNPSQLAVGMLDGTVAIYNVQCQNNTAIIADSRTSLKKHLQPVWQVIWTPQKLGLTGEQGTEVLVSVSADGRITKWFLYDNGLDSIDLMQLKRLQDLKQGVAVKKKNTNNLLSQMTPGLCFDFHPTDYGIYLVGTWDGLIHKCSYSNSQQILETYKKHNSAVNHIQWSPFCHDVFLSCSSDWSIQLWKQGHFTPVLSFTSAQSAMCSVKWSPNWPTLFAAINGQQLWIWELNVNVVSPTIVHYSAPGVEMTALLFATETDCVLVGDSDGQVNVYKLKNLNVRRDKQVVCLEDIIQFAVSRQL